MVINIKRFLVISITYCLSICQNKYKPRRCLEDWDFIMVFELKFKIQVEQHFNHIKQKKHVEFYYVEHDQDDKFLVLLKMDQQITEQQAHDLKILKKKKKRSYQLDLKSLNAMIYSSDSDVNSHYVSYLTWVKARLEPKNAKIYEQEKYSVFNKYKKQKYQTNAKGEIFTQDEELRAKYNYILTYCEVLEKKSALQDAYKYPYNIIMKHKGFVELIPIQKRSRYRPLILQSIRDYVGPNMQTYFDFVSFMQIWLIFPAAIGLLTVLFNLYFQFTADDSPGDFVYAFAIMIWSILFITKWENAQKWQKIKHQSGFSQSWSQHQKIISHQGLLLKSSRVTGKQEYFVPLSHQIWYYFISTSVCFLVLTLSMAFMILSLNARGFIQPSHKLIYFDWISQWAAPGGIFDANTSWGQIPNLFHVIITNAFDQAIYRPLAKRFTKYQRHLSPKTHENSIIIKFFIYQFIITFADLFYIAFVRFDIVGLRQQLLSLFFLDIIRRLIAQAAIPWLKNKFRAKKYQAKSKVKIQGIQQLKHYALLEVQKQQFQPFDDYLEIVTNFGYLVMISSCFPLAPVLILLAHAVQILQDRYKIVHIFKRKLPQKYVGMGYWKIIVVFLCYMSIITNILLFAFSSQQIVSYFPALFKGGKDILYGNTNFSDLLGGAANNLFQTMVSSTLSLNFTSNFGFSQGFSTNPMQVNPLFPPPPIVHESSNLSAASASPILSKFQPPSKDHEVTFIAILFVIEHVFLLLFIGLRNILKKQRTSAEIFIERKNYKRKIKKYLSKDLLATIFRDKMVNNLLFKTSLQGQTEQSMSTHSDRNSIIGLQNLISSLSLGEEEQINVNKPENIFQLLSEKQQ